MRMLISCMVRFSLVTGCLMTGCNGTDENEFGGTLAIPVEEVIMPETGLVNEAIAIQIHAKAVNGCFSDPKIMMRQISSRHYLIRATGFFEDADPCPAVLVSADTTIYFTPTSAGEYYFHINENPLPARTDTLTIQ